MQCLTSANDVSMSWAVCPKEEHRTSSHCDFAEPCLHASANHLSELLQYECSFSMNPFVSCISSIFPCCWLCMCVLSLTFFFSLPLLSSSSFRCHFCNQCSLSPCCYCSLILTFNLASSFILHCQYNAMCLSCETSFSAASIMSAVKHWVARKTHVVAVHKQ